MTKLFSSFHEYLINGKKEAVNPSCEGTKFAAYSAYTVPANSSVVVRLRLYDEKSKTGAAPQTAFENFDHLFETRRNEEDLFYRDIYKNVSEEELLVAKQASAGTDQFLS